MGEKPEKSYKLLLTLPEPVWMDHLNEWRRAQPDMPSAAEAIRRIVEAEVSKPKWRIKKRKS